MAKTVETTSVQREVAIAASPETVWEFFVDPAKVTRWMGRAVELDARPGGSFRMDVVPGHVAGGEFIELDRPRRLVYTWGWEPGEDGANAVPVGSTTIEIDLIPDGGGTLLRFTHSALPGDEAASSHAYGWDHYLARLTVAAAGGDPGPDPWLSGQM